MALQEQLLSRKAMLKLIKSYKQIKGGYNLQHHLAHRSQCYKMRTNQKGLSRDHISLICRVGRTRGKGWVWESEVPFLRLSSVLCSLALRGAMTEQHDAQPNPRITYVFYIRAKKQWTKKQNNTQKIYIAKQAVQIVWKDANWSPQLGTRIQ